MTGKHRLERMRLSRIGADGLHTDPEDIALPGEEWHTAGIEAGRMRAVGAGIEELAARSMLRPIGADQHPGAARDAPMARLPLLHDGLRQEEIRVCRRPTRHIDDACRTDEALHGNVV